MTNINIEHLRAFVAVAEFGGVNIAAEKLFKSPSTISHALNKLQTQLDLNLFELNGRKLLLTAHGHTMLAQAKTLIDEKSTLLGIANHLKQDHRAEISLAVDPILPSNLLFTALRQFSKAHPICDINLYEGILSGSEEQLFSGNAQICIGYRIPQGFLGQRLITIPFAPVVSATHPLANQALISSRQLMSHRQVVISDSGKQSNIDSGWLKAKQRWSVSSIYAAIETIKSGMAFGWIPEHMITQLLETGEFIKLPLKFGGEKSGTLFITLADEDCTMSNALAKILIEHAN